jgi:hypothetical protein
MPQSDIGGDNLGNKKPRTTATMRVSMNRMTSAMFGLLPYLLVFIGLAVMLVPDGHIGRGSGLIVFLAGLGIFKLHIELRARAPIPLDTRQHGHH